LAFFCKITTEFGLLKKLTNDSYFLCQFAVR